MSFIFNTKRMTSGTGHPNSSHWKDFPHCSLTRPSLSQLMFNFSLDPYIDPKYSWSEFGLCSPLVGHVGNLIWTTVVSLEVDTSTTVMDALWSGFPVYAGFFLPFAPFNGQFGICLFYIMSNCGWAHLNLRFVGWQILFWMASSRSMFA